MAPRSVPVAGPDCMTESANGAPTAMSGTPLPSMSPMPADALPNRSPAPSTMPVDPSLITVLRLTVPSEFIWIMRTCPKSLLPSESGAPAAMSGTPSRSMSPMPATEPPSPSPRDSGGAGIVPSFMAAWLSGRPSRPMKST